MQDFLQNKNSLAIYISFLYNDKESFWLKHHLNRRPKGFLANHQERGLWP
jgi:hypothetical protein